MTRITRSTSTRLLSQTPAAELTKPRTRKQSTRPPIIINSSSESSDEEEVEIVYKKPTVPVTPNKNKSRKAKDFELNELSPVTPPKQKKFNNENTIARTPQTPSSLLKKLELNSPPTAAVAKTNRKKLFNETDIYQNAKKALNSSLPTTLPGREKELEQLKEFMLEHLKLGSSGTLYVSGPPGTGKTASLNIILQENDIASKFQQVYVNCTSIKSAVSIYSRIVKELGIKTSSKTEKESLAAIEGYLKRNHKTILLILDEIDQLESKNQSVLYTIFEWPSKPNSKLVLIGIANALDLTDRILPRLQIRCELKPKLMHFAPYTKQQIVGIFTERLKEAQVLTIFSPVALQMLAGKVAAVSGDVRRALDIGRRVIELVERTAKETQETDALKSLENLIDDSSSKETTTTTTTTAKKVVDLKQVVDVLNNIYGTTQNLVTDEENDTASFPLQQKIIICTLLLILKKAKNKDVTVGKLHDVYRKVCSKRNLLGVDQSEFVGLCSLIETKGIIRVNGKKEARLHKVCLEWDQDEVVAVLKDKQLISSILENDASCLGKL